MALLQKFAVTLLLLSLVAPACAAQWREVGEVPGTGTQVFVDDASLNVDHDTIVKGWVRFEYAKPQLRDGYKLNAYVSQRLVNCQANRYWLVDGWGYRDKAEPVRLYSQAQGWENPAPDSENEIAAAVLCVETKSVLGGLWDKLQIAQTLQLAWRLLTAAVGI